MNEMFIWIIIGILILIRMESSIGKLRREVERTNLTLEKIAKQIGVPDTNIDNIDDELKNLLEKGKKIEAIKRYRIVTGLSLKQSKEYVDSLSE